MSRKLSRDREEIRKRTTDAIARLVEMGVSLHKSATLIKEKESLSISVRTLELWYQTRSSWREK